MRILKESYEEAKRLLNENREVMDEIAEFLIEKETITGKEFMEIFRRCKGIPDPEEKKDETNKDEKVENEKAGSEKTEDNKNPAEESLTKKNTEITNNTEGESGWESQNSQEDLKDTAGWTEVK